MFSVFVFELNTIRFSGWMEEFHLLQALETFLLFRSYFHGKTVEYVFKNKLLVFPKVEGSKGT